MTGLTSGAQAWRYEFFLLSTLLSIELDGSAAGIYFDRTSPGSGTAGSGDLVLGLPFPQGAEALAVVTYSDAVSVGGNPPQGDLYAKLKIDFSAISPAEQPGLIPENFSFTQDTDRAIPEPDSGLMVCGGLLLITCCLRVMRGSVAPATKLRPAPLA